MITRRELAARATALAVSTAFEAAVARAEEDLVGLRLKPRFGTRVWLPKGAQPGWVAPAARGPEEVLEGQGAALIVHLLLHPLRVYELHATPPRRVVAVVGSYQAVSTGEIYLAVGRLHVEQKGNRVLDSGPFDVVLVPVADAPLIHAEFERLAESLADVEIRNVKSGNSAVIIGGAVNAPSPEWRSRVAATLWSFGFRTADVLEEPWRREASANHRLSQQSADLYVFLRSWLVDASGQNHTDRFIKLVRGLRVVDTGDAATLNYALAAIRRALDQMRIDSPVAVPVQATATTIEEPAFAPSTWQEFHDNLDRLICEAFVLTDRAIAECVAGGYPDPARMWDHLERLADAAMAWVAADCSVGASFPDWIRTFNGLNVAMFDAAIEATRQDSFFFEGIKLSRLPHIQVDQAKAFTQIGRIHFALDPDHGRVVVDHIGLKLLGRQAAT